MRSDHCWSHGRGRPSASFHAGSCTARARASLRQRHAEHLQHDALDVVLRLRLGEAERVDLHAVAEAALLRVGHAVALAGELVPELDERAHLAHLLDEAHAGVDEERDAADDLAEALGRHLAGVAHRVEHGDRGGHRVGDLLHRRRAGLLQVVAADVDRVPLRDVGDRVGDHVGDQPQRRRGREDVGPAREVLLDDVVLRGARQLPRRSTPCSSATATYSASSHIAVALIVIEVFISVERDAVEQRAHVAEVADRHADLADLAAGELGVGVVAGLRRQVEGDRQAGLALGEVAPVELVGRRRPRSARRRCASPRACPWPCQPP